MGSSITVILAIPGFIKKIQEIRLSGLFTNNSLQYHDPDNRGLGFFSRLSGTFSGPGHSDNGGLAVLETFYICSSIMYLIVHRVWIELLSQLKSKQLHLWFFNSNPKLSRVWAYLT